MGEVAPITVNRFRRILRRVIQTRQSGVFVDQLSRNHCDLGEKIRGIKGGHIYVVDIYNLKDEEKTLVFGDILRTIYALYAQSDVAEEDLPNKVIIFVDELNKYAPEGTKGSPILDQVLEVAKPGGLVVDYLGLAAELKQALAVYTESGGTGETAIDQVRAVELMQEKYEICCDFMAGFDRSRWITGNAEQRLAVLPAAQEHLLAQAAKQEKPDEYKQKFLLAVRQLSAAFALSVPHEQALAIRDDVGFFQAVRAALMKSATDRKRSPEEIDAAIRQIISRAVVSDEVIDIFAAAGLKRPDISILDEKFLAEVRNMPQKNLAVELLRKLLKDELRVRQRKFLVQSRSFAEMLEQSIRKYQNRAVEAAQVIEELIALAKDMREANRRGEKLNLSDDELAFYDALEVNDSAVKVLGEPTLTAIARELVAAVRNSVTIDWTERETVRSQIRVLVKRILRKYGYPPDKQEKATQTVLQQAELLCAEWVG